MKLTDILVRDACLVDMRGRTKAEVLRELADALVGAVPGLDRAELLRDAASSARSSAPPRWATASRSRTRASSRSTACSRCSGSRAAGVDFDSLDGRPTHLFFLLVAPGREGSAHLLLLARLSRLLGSTPSARGCAR